MAGSAYRVAAASTLFLASTVCRRQWCWSQTCSQTPTTASLWRARTEYRTWALRPEGKSSSMSQPPRQVSVWQISQNCSPLKWKLEMWSKKKYTFFLESKNFTAKLHTKQTFVAPFIRRKACNTYLHLISCLEFWCAAITTNSEPCVFKTLIWSSARERCVSGTRRDVWMQRLSRREAICTSAAFMTRYLKVWGEEERHFSELSSNLSTLASGVALPPATFQHQGVTPGY